MGAKHSSEFATTSSLKQLPLAAQMPPAITNDNKIPSLNFRNGVVHEKYPQQPVTDAGRKQFEQIHAWTDPRWAIYRPVSICCAWKSRREIRAETDMASGLWRLTEIAADRSLRR
jgi:hypothetical protein